MSEKLICIYKITSPSGRVYIGQTWDYHKRYKSGVSKNQRLLYRSYLKYGEGAHKKEILETFEQSVTQQMLDDREIYFINHFKKMGFSLLNIRDGGSKGKNSPESIKLAKEKRRIWIINNPEKVKENQSKAAKSNIGKKRSQETRSRQSEIAKGKTFSNEHKANISKAKKGCIGPNLGRRFTGEALQNIRKAAMRRRDKGKLVIQYSISGTFLKEWPCIKTAARELHLSDSTITGCVNKRKSYKTCGGFIWRYKNDNTPINADDHKQTYNPKKKSVIQYSINGLFMMNFETVKDAAEKTGTNKTSLIRCCRDKQKSAGGYIWKYKT